MGKKYHIRPDGTYSICRATKKACPYGSIQTHYENLDEAISISDKLNEKLQKIDFGFVKENDHIYFNKTTEKGLIQLKNFQANLDKFESLRKTAREEITKVLENKHLSQIIDSDFIVKYKKGYTSQKIDLNKFYESDLSEKYSKKSIKKESLLFSKKEFSEKYNKFIDELRKKESTPILNIKLEVDENGYLNIEKTFKEKIQKLIDFERKLEEAREIENNIKKELIKNMKENHLEKVEVKGFSLELLPDREEVVPDLERMKKDNIFHDFSKFYQTPSCVVIKTNR